MPYQISIKFPRPHEMVVPQRMSPLGVQWLVALAPNDLLGRMLCGPPHDGHERNRHKIHEGKFVSSTSLQSCSKVLSKNPGSQWFQKNRVPVASLSGFDSNGQGYVGIAGGLPVSPLARALEACDRGCAGLFTCASTLQLFGYPISMPVSPDLQDGMR